VTPGREHCNPHGAGGGSNPENANRHETGRTKMASRTKIHFRPDVKRLAGLALIGLAIALSPSDGLGADATTPTPATPEPALVKVFNRPVAVFRGSNLGYNPKQRADYVEERVAKLIEEYPAGDIATRATSEGIIITIGGERAFALTPGDVDPIGEQTLEQTAQVSVKELREVVGAMQKQHEWPFLIKSTLLSLGATLIFGGVVWIVQRVGRWVIPRVNALVRRMSDRLLKGGYFILSQVAHFIHWMVRIIVWTVGLASAYFWLTFCLGQFPYTQPWADHLGGFMTSTLSGLIDSGVTMLPNLFVVAVIALAALMLGRIVRGFFQSVQKGQMVISWLDTQAAKATGRIAVVIIWVFAVVMMYPYLPGSGSQAFRGVSVFMGLLISIGASGVVGQFTGGLVLMYSKALRPGEYVRVGEHEGTVLSVGFLSTKILTPWHEEVHLPNLMLLNTSLKNYSRQAASEGVIAHTAVTIGYGTPWRQVQGLLLEAAGRTPGLRRDPAPYVYQKALSDFYVEYQLNATLDEPQRRVPTLSVLHANIQDLFNEYGVQIMSPHYVHDPPEKVFVPRDQWFAAPAAAESAKTGPAPGHASTPQTEKP
jgi:small-conductance mechanosensitive channel